MTNKNNFNKAITVFPLLLEVAKDKLQGYTLDKLGEALKVSSYFCIIT